jgi:hypothetical protein
MAAEILFCADRERQLTAANRSGPGLIVQTISSAEKIAAHSPVPGKGLQIADLQAFSRHAPKKSASIWKRI